MRQWGVIKKVQILFFFSSLQRPVYPSFYKQNITASHRPGLMENKTNKQKNKSQKYKKKKMLVTKNGKQDEKDRRKDRKEQNIINSCRVTAKSLQKINGKKYLPHHWFRQYRTASASYQISQIPPKDSSAATQCTETFGEQQFSQPMTNLSSDSSCALPSISESLNPSTKFHKQYENPPAPHTHTFGMKKTSLTRYKIDVSKWNSVHASHTRQFHTEPISHVLMERKKRGNQS